MAESEKPDAERDSAWDVEERYTAEGTASLIDLIHRTGLLFTINAAILHHHGLALGISLDDAGDADAITLYRTTDPEGVWFDEELLKVGRERLRTHGLVLTPGEWGT